MLEMSLEETSQNSRLKSDICSQPEEEVVIFAHKVKVAFYHDNANKTTCTGCSSFAYKLALRLFLSGNFTSNNSFFLPDTCRS